MKEYKQLIQKAIEAKAFAYVPYSNFRIGCALLTKDDKIYTGCNIENASYGATNCAERTAIFKAVSEGDKDIQTIAIASDEIDFITPCGICRQVIREFGDEVDIILINKDGYIKQTTIEKLLPHSFSKDQLIGDERNE